MARLKREDIDFTCEKCGACCRVEGYVFLEAGEAERLAGFLGMRLKEFKKQYTYWFFIFGRVLRTQSTGCPFLVNNRCSVYEARPKQCSSFPYWKRILNGGTKEWAHISGYCPAAGKALK